MPSIPRARRYVALHERYVKDGVLVLYSSRRIRLFPGDGLVLFARAAGEVSFMGAGVLGRETDRSGEVERTEDRGERSRFEARVEAYAAFDSPVSLDELAFSLPRIRNTDQPWRHFLRPYTILDEIDVDVLRDERVFWARTAIGLLAKNIPQDIRRVMALSVLVSDARAANDLTVAWPLFREQIEEVYLEPARIIEAIETDLRGLDPTGELGLLRLEIRDVETPDVRLGLALAAGDARRLLVSFGEMRPVDGQETTRLLIELDQRVAVDRPGEAVRRAFRERLWPFEVLA